MLHSSDICVWLKSLPRKAQRFHVIHACLITKVIQQFLAAASDSFPAHASASLLCSRKMCTAQAATQRRKSVPFAPPVPRLFLSEFNSSDLRSLLCVAIDPFYHRLAVTLSLKVNPFGGRRGLRYHGFQFSRLFAGNASTFLLQVYRRLPHGRRELRHGGQAQKRSTKVRLGRGPEANSSMSLPRISGTYKKSCKARKEAKAGHSRQIQRRILKSMTCTRKQ